jgi:hypothetical protein
MTERLGLAEGGSASDGVQSLTGNTGQLPEVFLDAPPGCDPGCSSGDVTTGRLRSEDIGGVVGDLKAGSDLDCSVDDSIPYGTPIGLGGTLADGIDDPARWLVGDGVEPVLVSGAGLLVESDVAAKKVVPTVDRRGGSSQFKLYFQGGQALVQLAAAI